MHIANVVVAAAVVRINIIVFDGHNIGYIIIYCATVVVGIVGIPRCILRFLIRFDKYKTFAGTTLQHFGERN